MILHVYAQTIRIVIARNSRCYCFISTVILLCQLGFLCHLAAAVCRLRPCTGNILYTGAACIRRCDDKCHVFCLNLLHWLRNLRRRLCPVNLCDRDRLYYRFPACGKDKGIAAIRRRRIRIPGDCLLRPGRCSDLHDSPCGFLCRYGYFPLSRPCTIVHGKDDVRQLTGRSARKIKNAAGKGLSTRGIVNSPRMEIPCAGGLPVRYF